MTSFTSGDPGALRGRHGLLSVTETSQTQAQTLPSATDPPSGRAVFLQVLEGSANIFRTPRRHHSGGLGRGLGSQQSSLSLVFFWGPLRDFSFLM